MSKTLLILLATAAFAHPIYVSAEQPHNHDEKYSTHHAETNPKKHELLGKDSKPTSKHEHTKHNHAEENNLIEITESRMLNAGISLSTVATGNLGHTLFFPGEVSINGDSLVHVSPRFEGTIKKVMKHIGEEVKKGEVLATVQSNESLSTYNIKAEIDGQIISKDASQGEFATNNKILFTIANFNTVWINAAVHTRDLKSVQVGLSAHVWSKTINSKQQGIISYVRPTLNKTTRTALARIVLDNSERNWFPGMFVDVSLTIPSPNSNLVIPVESAVFIKNEHIAFVKEDGQHGEHRFSVRDIKIGKDNGYQIEVLSGLKLGEKVASGETFILKAELGKNSAQHDH